MTHEHKQNLELWEELPNAWEIPVYDTPEEAFAEPLDEDANISN